MPGTNSTIKKTTKERKKKCIELIIKRELKADLMLDSEGIERVK